MATGNISFKISADHSAALAAVDKTDKAVKQLGQDAAGTAATMVSAAKMEAAAWENVAHKIAATKTAMSKQTSGGGLLGGLGAIGAAGFGISAIKSALSGVGGAILAASDAAREFDNSVIKLRTGLGVTSEQGEAMARSLQEAWRTGKSSMGDLTETTRRLSEVMSGEQAVEWTKLLEDYAVQTGQSVATLGTQLTKALQAGTVAERDLKAIARGGIQVWDLLSQTMGKSREEVQQLGKDGKISGADLQAALLAGRDAAREFNEQTSADSFETLSRTGQLAMQKLGKGINKGLKPAIRGLIDSAGELSEKWEDALEGIGKRLGALIAPLVKFASKLATLLKPIDGSRYEYGASLTKADAKRLGFEDADSYSGADWENDTRYMRGAGISIAAEAAVKAANAVSAGPTVTADPLADAKKKRAAAAKKAADDAADLDARLADAYAANREEMEKSRIAEESQRLLEAELKQLSDREKAWELNQKIADENAKLADKMERRQRLRDSMEADAAAFDRQRSWIEHATPRQLDLYNRGKALGIDMSNPNSQDFKQVMRGFNPLSGKSFVQEQREQRIQAALNRGVRGTRSLSAQGSLRERMAGRTISSHRDDAEQGQKEPYLKPLADIGKTLTTIADNTAVEPVAVFS